MNDGTFEDAGQARTYAAINGIDFDNQDDYCEACRAYHVGVDHDQAITEQCGAAYLAGYAAAFDCVRTPHPGDPSHRSIDGTSWDD